MFLDFLSTTPIWILGLVLLAALLAAARLGRATRHRHADAKDDHGEGYSVSAILGLLALLTGFTFSLAIERFESRREMVLEHANAIGTAYLRIQLLPEPHRARLSGLIVGPSIGTQSSAFIPPLPSRARPAPSSTRPSMLMPIGKRPLSERGTTRAPGAMPATLPTGIKNTLLPEKPMTSASTCTG